MTDSEHKIVRSLSATKPNRFQSLEITVWIIVSANSHNLAAQCLCLAVTKGLSGRRRGGWRRRRERARCYTRRQQMLRWMKGRTDFTRSRGDTARWQYQGSILHRPFCQKAEIAVIRWKKRAGFILVARKCVLSVWEQILSTKRHLFASSVA